MYCIVQDQTYIFVSSSRRRQFKIQKPHFTLAKQRFVENRFESKPCYLNFEAEKAKFHIKAMKKLTVILLTLVSLNAMSMGFPNSTHPTQPQVTKCDVAENEKAVKVLASYAESIGQEVAIQEEENTKTPQSLVERITNVIVKILSSDSDDTEEKVVAKDALLRNKEEELLKNKVFLGLIEGVAYYLSEKREEI